MLCSDVRRLTFLTSILNISYKCISATLFSVAFHQMCAWNIKKWVVVHFFSFGGKRTNNVLKTSQSEVRSMMSMGRYQDIDLIAIHKIGFCEIYFLYFLVPSVYHTFHCHNKFKHLMCSILVLEQNKTKIRSLQDIVGTLHVDWMINSVKFLLLNVRSINAMQKHSHLLNHILVFWRYLQK